MRPQDFRFRRVIPASWSRWGVSYRPEVEGQAPWSAALLRPPRVGQEVQRDGERWVVVEAASEALGGAFPVMRRSDVLELEALVSAQGGVPPALQQVLDRLVPDGTWASAA